MKIFKFLVKNLWVGLTEAVNGLLDIPHHKSIMTIRQQLQHAFLRVVIILVLIDHDFVILILIKFTNISVFFQNLNGKMGNIRKFKSIFLDFRL